MRILTQLLLIVFAVASMSVAGEPVTLVLSTGEVVECVEVRRVLPTAVQFVDASGQVRMISKKDVPAEVAPKLLALLPTRTAPAANPTPRPAAPTGPVLYLDVVPVGSKSSTTYHYYTWYGYSRTTKSGATYEIRLNLARPKTLTVTVITLVGTNFEQNDVPLEQGHPTAIRIETTGSRTITNHYWYTHYAMDKRPRDAWFVQVVCNGKLYGEKGNRPANLPNGAILEAPGSHPG